MSKGDTNFISWGLEIVKRLHDLISMETIIGLVLCPSTSLVQTLSAMLHSYQQGAQRILVANIIRNDKILIFIYVCLFFREFVIRWGWFVSLLLTCIEFVPPSMFFRVFKPQTLAVTIHSSICIFMFLRQKGRDLTQSYDKSRYTNRNVIRTK